MELCQTSGTLSPGNFSGGSYAGDNTSGIYWWGSQFEISSTVGTYSPTTSSANSAPRFDHVYNGTSWVSRGLLVEEQRTNLVQYSQLVGSTGWLSINSGSTNPVVTANFATAPDGSTTASKIVFPSTSGTQVSKVYQQITSMSGAHAISIYLKGDVGGEIVYLIGYNGTSYFSTTCTLTTSWQRFSASTGSSNQGFIQLGREPDAGNGPMSACTVYAWGAQGEQGSFATSYIPNLTTGSATRSADVCRITGSDFSSFWNQSEGSFAVDYDLPDSVQQDRGLLNANDGTNTKYVTFYAQSGSGQPGKNAYLVFDGPLSASIYGQTVLANTSTKMAACWKINDFALSVNGSAVSTDTSGTVPSGLDRLEIGKGYFGGDQIKSGHIARLRYYPVRIPNATLQTLST
jgi:hypothetical protein